jgi:tyrosyl-tRNA synthetase
MANGIAINTQFWQTELTQNVRQPKALEFGTKSYLMKLTKFMFEEGLVPSLSVAKRLIATKHVQIDGELVEDIMHELDEEAREVRVGQVTVTHRGEENP